MWNPNLEPYTKDNTDQTKIKAGQAVPCRICEVAFQRLRITRRYCMSCKRGFCDGEHGNLANGRGQCVRCGPQPA